METQYFFSHSHLREDLVARVNPKCEIPEPMATLRLVYFLSSLKLRLKLPQ
jgi:hypothetical protein